MAELMNIKRFKELRTLKLRLEALDDAWNLLDELRQMMDDMPALVEEEDRKGYLLEERRNMLWGRKKQLLQEIFYVIEEC
jgi:hypothetical protein